MTRDQALLALCEVLLLDPRVTEQAGWQKLILVGEVAEGELGMRGYSYDAQRNGKLVAPKASSLEALRQLHTVMKAANPSGRGWLKCMIRISRAGEVGADFEYNDPKRWEHTTDNYLERIREYAAMPV